VHKPSRASLALLSAGAVLAATSCSARGASDEVSIAVGVYPLEFVARRVAGEGADVLNVTPPAAEPHDVELTSSQVVSIAEADLILYIGGGFQPAVEKLAAEAGDRAVDLSIGPDPHLWLYPLQLADVARVTADQLERVDPEDSGFALQADRLRHELQQLDQEFRAGLEDCERRDIVTSHEAFGVLAEHYGLRQIGIAGLDAEGEPSPQRLAEVAELVRERDVEVIYFERLLPPDLAETIAEETGARTALLDPIESEPEEGDYFSAMRDNLDALREGLGCR
jgi:zinc transport system substrate-binding protein